MTAPKLGPLARSMAARQRQAGSPAAARVAFLIAAYLDAGVVDPSIRELGRRLGLAPAAVLEHVAELQRRDVISFKRGYHGARNTYRIVNRNNGGTP